MAPARVAGAAALALSILFTACRGEPPALFADDVLGGSGHNGGFTTLSPDPNLLVWDPPSARRPAFRAGWLNVPVLHDPYITTFEKSPRACLRVLMKPAALQPARLGPILLHCGGPGSDATCALEWGRWLELNSSYLVGPPLSDDYDYWSISQRGMEQDTLEHYGFNKTTCPFKDERSKPILSWPSARCSGIDNLIAESGIEEVLRRLEGNPDKGMWDMLQLVRHGADSQTFGVPFYNETYARWLYRLVALEHNLCFQDGRYAAHSSATHRSYNVLDHSGTTALGHDIELFRTAIGAKKMSVYGVSYGTKVGSVYATVFPDKVHRLVLDGDMGSDPDVQLFAGWVGESVEAVWAGLAMACDNSVMRGGPPETICPAGPGVTTKLQTLLQQASTPAQKANAIALFFEFSGTVYHPGVPNAARFMKCLATTYATGNMSHCSTQPSSSMTYPGLEGLEVIGQVLGLDLAGRLTEQSFIEWWRAEKEKQPVGIMRALPFVAVVGTWPAVPQPVPPAGNPSVAPLVIGNLHDGQTPYNNAQKMLEAFPSGRLLTSQFYGHGLQGPDNVSAVVQRYEEEMRRGVRPTYDDEVAKLLCVKVALEYLKDGTLPRDYVCKAAGPVKTGPGGAPRVARARAPLPPRAPVLIV